MSITLPSRDEARASERRLRLRFDGAIDGDLHLSVSATEIYVQQLTVGDWYDLKFELADNKPPEQAPE